MNFNASTAYNVTHAIVYGNYIYGISRSGGPGGGYGVLFTFNPTSGAFSIKRSFSGGSDGGGGGYLTGYNGKIYGVGGSQGTNLKGVIFEYDTTSGALVFKQQFTDNSGYGSSGSPMVLVNGKFYGTHFYGGPSHFGQLFEYDPSSNVYSIKRYFDANDGAGNPLGKFKVKNNILYGIGSNGGIYSFAGVAYTYNPSSGATVITAQFGSPPLYTLTGSRPYNQDEMIALPAKIADGRANTCQTAPRVTINAANNNTNTWVSITDSFNNIIAEIRSNGNNLGIVNTSLYLNTGTVRQVNNHAIYLDRNITITPATQPSSPVDVRLYIKKSEVDSVTNAALAALLGVGSVNDLEVYKTSTTCGSISTSLPSSSRLSGVTVEEWDGNYVLSMQVSSFSTFYIGKSNPAMMLNATAFLQGAGATSPMSITLSGLTTFPKSQPYNIAPFNYAGTESVVTIPANITDWVLVELRNATIPATVVATRAAFIKNDGTIVDTNGVSPVVFNDAIAGNYYVAIRHRNHLGVRSSATIAFTADITPSYDFTNAQSQAYQNTTITSNAAMALLSNGKYAMWGGNANSNDRVNYGAIGSDRIFILSGTALIGSIIQGLNNNQATVLSNVYSNNDLNMNGTVNYGSIGSDRIFLLSTVLQNAQSNTITQHQ
jgi:hypothetical protein